MKRQTAVERLNKFVALEDAMNLVKELDAANATLKEIADEGGKHTDEGFLICDGRWCAERARRRLEWLE